MTHHTERADLMADIVGGALAATLPTDAERRRLRSLALHLDDTSDPGGWLVRMAPRLPRRMLCDLVDAVLGALVPPARRVRTIEGAEALQHLAGGRLACPACGSSSVFLANAGTLLGSESAITVAGTIAWVESGVEGDALAIGFGCESCASDFAVRFQHVDDETAIAIDILEDDAASRGATKTNGIETRTN
jgi:hypothetical protein